MYQGTTSKSSQSLPPVHLTRNVSTASLESKASSTALLTSGVHETIEHTVWFPRKKRVVSFIDLEKIRAEDDWFAENSFIACRKEFHQIEGTNAGETVYVTYLITGTNGPQFLGARVEMFKDGPHTEVTIAVLEETLEPSH